jgi:uncharacterized protein YjaZ
VIKKTEQTEMPKAIIYLLFSLTFSCHFANAQFQKIEFNKEYKDIQLDKTSILIYSLPLVKDGIYQFSILQQGIAVDYTLTTSDNKLIYKSNYPDDLVGYEKFEHSPGISGNYILTIKRFEDPENADSGRITLLVKSLNKQEISVRKKIKKELEPENAKNVTTIDIDHFWDAFDNLKNCKTFLDSVNSFQFLYLDKATNGLLDFIQARDLTAEKYVDVVSKNSAFYKSVRQNTYEAKKAEPTIQEVFTRFKEIYADFKPFKVCFAIGIKNTGGTVSNQFVLIGTEITTSTKNMDSVNSNEIVQKLKAIVAHECVHTQLKPYADPNALKCALLYQSMKEGSCDFIAELITGNSRSSEYGEKNENKLWTEFKNELCNQNIAHWLYNGSTVKDKPADLGYFIGYSIVKEYYKNALDKKQAVIDIINMSDPMQFLLASKYDGKMKK